MNKRRLNKEIKTLEELKLYRKWNINFAIRDLDKEHKDLNEKFIEAIHFLYWLKTFSTPSDEILQDELNDVDYSLKNYDNVVDIIDNFQYFCKNYDCYAKEFFNKYIKKSDDKKTVEEEWKKFTSSSTRSRLNVLYNNDVLILYQLSKIKDLDNEAYILELEKMNINKDILDRNQIQDNENAEKTVQDDETKEENSSSRM
ncbi:hypothetical protein [Mycoplasma seminis]|uniref:Uncharacterized protein n=1 Tax=Mycoplasma seminis TaxID=512749 RepID=A0ABY9H9K5_9MOLU|nr:hypothetical protein [Mycoplasma seminis]WLP85212.1 hypothetical protein Q8852_02730 [Mycoplasma seminis]